MNTFNNILPGTVKEKDAEPLAIKFPAGNTLVVDRQQGKLMLLDNNEMLQLSVQVTGNGLEVNVKANVLNIEAKEQINLAAKKINMDASEQINLNSGGHMVQQVAKDLLTETKGTHKNIAQTQKLTASLGNVHLKANDDIRLDGERVLLNCD